MNARAQEALDEWIGGALGVVGNIPATREEAEPYREHAVTDLDNDGISEDDIDAVVGGDFAGYLLRSLNPEWIDESEAL